MTEITEKEYIETVIASAAQLWGDEEAKKMQDHLENTAGAVWRLGKNELTPGIEPATKLRHPK